MDKIERRQFSDDEMGEAVYVFPAEELDRPSAASALSLRARAAIAVALVVVALVSGFPLREHFSAPETYADTIATIDEKKANVLGLVASSTALSAAITAIPDDTGTPVAEKLMEVSGDLGIVLSVLYLEKYLLTIFGLAAFGILVPAACALLAAAVLLAGRVSWDGALARLAAKLVALALVILVTIPASVAVTRMIDDTYAGSVAPVEEVAETQSDEQSDEGGSPLDFILNLPSMVADGLTSITDGVLDQVNALIEWLAVMVVTSCVIPLIVLLFFLWVANAILGIDVSAPMGALRGRARRLVPARRGR
ncbi:hypothetical protein E0L17_01175 [Olsenella sp. SW781]|uniref:hypothetical protein n=1 Tax=Olsenella sp. SW781 TaxID=2530046 RepID=UPI00143A36B5|nr:hypothetical protein [Olsenella sp. SW781]NJE79950.1 hypothetical protein [Olsenella sp. SW781]